MAVRDPFDFGHQGTQGFSRNQLFTWKTSGDLLYGAYDSFPYPSHVRGTRRVKFPFDIPLVKEGLDFLLVTIQS